MTVSQTTNAPGTPRRIWSAWLQGRTSAPEIVQRIFGLWEQMNPDCTVHVVEQSEADQILQNLGVRQQRITPQVTANIVRTYLLAEHGGTWVDATLLPTQPLGDWLFDRLDTEGFFAFRSTGDPNLVLQNWFLCGRSENRLIVEWLDLYVDYFSTSRLRPSWKRALASGAFHHYLRYKMAIGQRDTLWFVDPAKGRDCKVYPYAAHNYNLAYLLKTRPELKEMWDRVPDRTHALPGLIGRLSKDKETSLESFLCAAIQVLDVAPVHKLNSRDPRLVFLVEEVERRMSQGV